MDWPAGECPAVFAFISLMLWPRLPLPDDERIVALRQYDQAMALSNPSPSRK